MRKLIVLLLLAACGRDPVYERCITERQTYCKRLFACVQLGQLVGIQVNFENESQCTTSESKRCDTVSSASACPGGSSFSYDSAKHEQCIKDQDTQSCGAFASRPTSCETYCSTTTH